MKKIFLFSALISFTIFTSCNKEESAVSYLPEVEEQVSYIGKTNKEVNTELAGEAAFTIDNDDNVVWEKDELLLTNNSLNAVSYHWDFGNGETSTEANPTYSNYKMHGPFTVTLTVTDALGDTHQASHDITVLCIFGGAPHQF